MAKLFTKKLNKRGFTLAELLIVVAILAILIAVAVPVYTSAMRDAQQRVNEANARALKGAAVSQILANWTKDEGGSAATKNKLSRGALSVSGYASGDSNFSTDGGAVGWYAWAKFDKNGHMDDVHVRVNLQAAAAGGGNEKTLSSLASNECVMAVPSGSGNAYSNTWTPSASNTSGAVDVSSDTSGKTPNDNVVIVLITGTDINK